MLFRQRILHTVFFYCLAVAVLTAAVSGAPAHGEGPVPDVADEQQIPVYVQADSITYDRKADIYYADGRVELTWKNLVLKADSVEMNRATRMAVARGRVALEQDDGGRMTCDRAEMNIDDQTGRIRNGVLYFDEYNLTVSGEEIERGQAGPVLCKKGHADHVFGQYSRLADHGKGSGTQGGWCGEDQKCDVRCP